jgi:hypothetical protein
VENSSKKVRLSVSNCGEDGNMFHSLCRDDSY